MSISASARVRGDGGRVNNSENMSAFVLMYLHVLTLNPFIAGFRAPLSSEEKTNLLTVF